MRVQVHFFRFPVCKCIVLSHCICNTLCHGYTMLHGATPLPHRVHRAACAARLFWSRVSRLQRGPILLWSGFQANKVLLSSGALTQSRWSHLEISSLKSQEAIVSMQERGQNRGGCLLGKTGAYVLVLFSSLLSVLRRNKKVVQYRFISFQTSNIFTSSLPHPPTQSL